MAYATLADLTERAGDAELIQIADRDRDGQPDPEVVAAALEDADSQIDGYIATRYHAPLAQVPRIVRSWAVSIARYVLHANGAPDHVAQDYQDAIAALKDVAKGMVALPNADSVKAPEVAPMGSVMGEHRPEVFTSDRLRGWR